jgi:hypothetical protein
LPSDSGMARAVIPCQRGVDARLEHAQPDDQTNHYVGPDGHDPGPVQQPEHQNATARRQQHAQRKVGGVEERDHQNGAEIIDDRHGRQKHLERRRHPVAQQDQNAQGKSDVGGHRYRPASQGHPIAPVDRRVDQRRHHHAANRRARRQQGLAVGSQFTLDHLALDLQPDQKEENRHPQVIDPDHQGFGKDQQIGPDAQLHRQVDETFVDRTETGIARHQGHDGRQRKHHAAQRLGLNELAERALNLFQHGVERAAPMRCFARMRSAQFSRLATFSGIRRRTKAPGPTQPHSNQPDRPPP